MSTTPVTSALPPRDVTMPKGTTMSLMKVYVPVALVVMALLLAVNHRSSAVIGGAIAVAIIAAVLLVEVPLLLRAQDRRQRRLMQDLPPGSFFAGRARMLPLERGWGRPREGTIRFSLTDATFVPKRAGGPQAVDSWQDVDRLELVPKPGGVGLGRLTLVMKDGGTRRFVVPRYGAMARALTEQP